MVSKRPAVFEERSGEEEEVELVAVARRPRHRHRLHSGTYQFDNYSCPHCLRKFSAKSGLKIHVGIAHKGAKLLFCPRCPASFADVSACKQHFKEEHGARRGGRRRAREEQEAPHRSLVPSDEPVEGVPAAPEPETQAMEERVEETAAVERGVEGMVISETASQASSVGKTEAAAAVAAPKKAKARKPLPGLVKIQDLEARGATTLATLATKGPVARVRVGAAIPGTRAIAPATPLPPPVSSTAPVSVVPAAPLTSSQVYVPALTSAGTTILMKLEEAQRHLQQGSVTFLPSAAAAGPPILGHQQQILLAPRQPQPNIMRDKVALNLPVVMTKRTNKKVAQDNPFFKIQVSWRVSTTPPPAPPPGSLLGCVRTLPLLLLLHLRHLLPHLLHWRG